jgi:hypothetical protein
MVCQGVEGGEEASGVIVVARDLAVAMLSMAGVASALVGGGNRGRRHKAQGRLGPTWSWAMTCVGPVRLGST